MYYWVYFITYIVKIIRNSVSSVYFYIRERHQDYVFMYFVFRLKDLRFKPNGPKYRMKQMIDLFNKYFHIYFFIFYPYLNIDHWSNLVISLERNLSRDLVYRSHLKYFIEFLLIVVGKSMGRFFWLLLPYERLSKILNVTMVSVYSCGLFVLVGVWL